MKAAGRKVPENVRDVYDEASYAKWLSYHKEKTRLRFFRHIAMYAVTFIMIGFNVHARLLDLLCHRNIFIAHPFPPFAAAFSTFCGAANLLERK